MHNSLMKRYERELKMNVQHVETITELSVRPCFLKTSVHYLHSLHPFVLESCDLTCNTTLNFEQLKVNELEQKVREVKLHSQKLEREKLTRDKRGRKSRGSKTAPSESSEETGQFLSELVPKN